MKKITAILSVIGLGMLSVVAQGTIAFANNNSFPLLISPNANGTGATVIGTNAQSVSLGGGPAQVTVGLYVAANGTAVTFGATGAPIGLTLVGTATNVASTFSLAQGTFSGGNPFTLPAPFDGSSAIEYVYFASTLSGLYTGHSAIGTAYTPATGINTPGATFGASAPLVQGFTLTPVPEPGTLALGGLGAAALLLFRRRKS